MMFDRMFQNKSPAEIAEHVQKRRLTLMTLFPLLYISQQATFWLHQLDAPAPLRAVDKVQIAAYVAWSLSLLLLLATGGGLGRSPEVKALLSDEVTRAHRGRAYGAGFWALILGSLGLYLISIFTPLTSLVVLHALLTVGVLVPCLTFVVLERRADRA
jgi:hypothetical protein